MRIALSRVTAFLMPMLAAMLTACAVNGSDSSGAVYLQAITSNSVYVMAESSGEQALSVSYGQTPAYGRLAVTSVAAPTTGGTFIHRIPLEGLMPGTRYYYRLGSHINSFRTAVPPGTPFRFAWIGDTRTGTAIHDAIAARVADSDPAFSLYGGDLCDDGSSYRIYIEQFFRPAQLALSARVPFFNAVGNHEGWGTNTRAFLQAPASGSGNQGYYSFDYGDLHVVVMNYMEPAGYTAGSPQYQFVAADLAATAKIWKIVICHVPAYSSGGHGEDAGMMENTRTIFEPAGVDLVIAAHNHFYQRNFANGIYHLVIGSAGAPLYEPGPAAGYTQVSLKSHCWAVFDLTPTTLQMHAYDETGAEIDTLMLSK